MKPMIRIIFFIFLLLFNLKIYAKEIIVEFNSTNFFELGSLIKNNQNDGNLVLLFEDDYYDMSVINTVSAVDISVNSNISFIGNKNGTVFDYNYGKIGGFKFDFSRLKNDTVKFENITFKKYKEKVISQGMTTLTVFSSTDNYNMIFNNCNFIENEYVILNIVLTCKKTSNPFIFFNNCNF